MEINYINRKFYIKYNNFQLFIWIVWLLVHINWIIYVSGDIVTESDCLHEPNCLKCNSIIGCIRCPILITYDDRKCVTECPRGYIEQWSSQPDLIGRICRPNGYADPIIATVVGLTIGITLCIIIIILCIVMIKRKRNQNNIREILIDDNIDKDEFLKQLNALRPNAEFFLTMLNDIRRQIRKLYLAGDLNGANSYRPIVRDLAKILLLLNRPIDVIVQPPHDWNRVFNLSQKILDKYYKPEVTTELIDFLQTPPTTVHHHNSSSLMNKSISDPRLGPSQYSTFKSTSTQRSELNDGKQDIYQMQLFGSLINLHEINGQPETSTSTTNNPFRNSLNNLRNSTNNNNNFPSMDIHNSSLWLEDEFFKLGFRPQDEITTEL